MSYLKSIERGPAWPKKGSMFPFGLNCFKKWQNLELTSPVTLFVGENGSGKSTLLEALACALGVAATGINLKSEPTMQGARDLGRVLKLKFTIKTRQGLFLRAEDFYTFANSIKNYQKEMNEAAKDFEGRLSGYGLQLAKGAVLGSSHAYENTYGDLQTRSHGESFLDFFQARLKPKGIYLLDEPEGPLSPERQLALYALIKENVAKGAQFIIATHSPVLMHFAGAQIISFDKQGLKEVQLADLANLDFLRRFLNEPEAYLRHM